MAKRRSDFDRTFFGKFLNWFRGGESLLDREMTRSLSEKTERTEHSAASFALHEHEEMQLQRREQELKAQDYIRVHEWSSTKGRRLVRFLYGLFALLIGFSIILSLLVTVSNLPSFGNEQNPMNNEVAGRYLKNGLEEGGATNLVANMILDYRAFDTLGESNVLFIAVCSVILLLRVRQGDEKLDAEQNDRNYEPKNDVILQKSAGILVPVILLFGIYIVLNGHLSPGGGFSGGALMGAGLILYLNAAGFEKTERFFTFRTFKSVSLCALSFYALSKAYSFFTGANGLESFISNGKPGAILSAGLILPLNIAVGLVVCCTMYAFYTLFRKGDM